MNIEKQIFLKYTPDYNKIQEFGFCKKGKNYVFEKTFLNNNFKACISVNTNGFLTGKVYDIENNEEFLPLRLKNQEGSFIGSIKSEYKKLLVEIRDKCFIKNYFITPQGNRIGNLIIQKYGNIPVFMWKKYPNFGVFKNPDNNKWYGLLGYLERTKLNKKEKGFVEFLNLKIDSNKIPKLIEQEGFYLAYHMNKKYWITITLDDRVSDDKIMSLTDESYNYTIKKNK